MESCKPELVYGSLHLHIPGELSAQYSAFCTLLPSEDHELSYEEAFAFYKDGYFITHSAVPSELITRARQYIDGHYHRWLAKTKRQDDWRTHLELDLTNLSSDLKDHGPVLDLLLLSPKLIGRLHDLMGSIQGIFYTQIAFRTPSSRKESFSPGDESKLYGIGAEYHIDGQANAAGERFPDHWTVMVGIALVDIVTDEMGNFTVFPGGHTVRSWIDYPDAKRTKTLPSLGSCHKLRLRCGDAVFVHVLLPHRGGLNTLNGSLQTSEEDIASAVVHNIQANTREMVFFRVKACGIDYRSPSRSQAVLKNPWAEYSTLFEKFTLRDEDIKDIFILHPTVDA